MPDLDLGIRVRSFGSPIRIRRSTYVSMVAGRRDVFVHNSSVHNALLAAKIRVLTAEVDGKLVPIEETRQPTGHSHILDGVLTTMQRDLPILTPVPLEQFPGLYKAEKKKIYERAVSSLSVCPLTSDDSKIRAFIKFEKMLAKETGKPKAPRMISPPSPRFLVRTGCYVKPAEHAIYEAIDHMFGFKVVTKGMNFGEIGRLFKSHWDALDDPVAFDVDVEKMDRSTSSEMLAWTHKLIHACYRGDDLDDIREMLKQQLSVRTTVKCDDGNIKYTVDGTLTSGQMNTSLVGVSMVSSIMYTLFKERLDVPYRFVDAGDDCTVILDKRNADRFLCEVRKIFGEVGFAITIGPPSVELEQIEFCQGHPVLVGSSYTMVRNAKDAAIKDATSLQPMDSLREMAVWMEAVAKCGIASHGGVPIASSLYRCYARNSTRMQREMKMTQRQLKRFKLAVDKRKKDVVSWNQSNAEPMCALDVEPSPYTRLSYEKAFGLNSVFQLRMEQYYDTLVINWSRPVSQAQTTYNPLWSTV
ncbi:hypothetical protein 1 [Hubei tombus-like virus 10]|uniref:hypothetical protein 1 n=1 Tax=Hubei tombus-like virus 10 TaxID=1923256 RepID=UPI00090C694E|nr:hypothetical protein 1 [Hubei tombus-like virus 10]APG76526.1 hypothetical protein 1 [Hubei tombus-like virus 10]